MKGLPQQRIRAFYRALMDTYGQQHWWPARSRFEVIVGAYLTQNTAWTNVEHALKRLRKERLLSPDGIRHTASEQLEQLIRSAGFFRQKARSLKTFVEFLDESYGGSLDRMFAQPTADLRKQLLTLNGVGPETADSILLYAGGHPVFVVDAYTRRVLGRHGIVPAGAAYEDIRQLFEVALRGEESQAEQNSATAFTQKGEPAGSHRPSPMSTAKRSAVAQRYNEMHALIVRVGKNHCLKAQAQCDLCPLQKFLPNEN